MVPRRVGLAIALCALLVGGCSLGAGATSAGRARAGATASAKRCAADRSAGPMTFVSPFGFDASAGILDVFAARALGYFAAECLTVRFVTNSYTPYQLVSSGAATVTGEGSAADALVGMAHGGNFVAISTFADTSDYAILTRAGVPTLRGLEGKVLGYHTVLPVVLNEMLRAAHVDVAKVHEVNDTAYDPNLMIHGRFDGLQAYQSNEPITLRAEHASFHEFTPAEYHIPGTFNVQVVNRPFLRHHRQAVADFLRAELHAYDYCAAHASACITIERNLAAKAGVTFDVGHQLTEWRFETHLVATHALAGKGVGVQTTAEWQPELRALVAAKLVAPHGVPAGAEDTALAASLYRGTSLIWP